MFVLLVNRHQQENSNKYLIIIYIQTSKHCSNRIAHIRKENI
jgi:hypothetical protein